MRCDDCGTKLRSSGACPNCDEETVIYDEQITTMDLPIAISVEFNRKVEEGRRRAKKRLDAQIQSGSQSEGEK